MAYETSKKCLMPPPPLPAKEKKVEEKNELLFWDSKNGGRYWLYREQLEVETPAFGGLWKKKWVRSN